MSNPLYEAQSADAIFLVNVDGNSFYLERSNTSKCIGYSHICRYDGGHSGISGLCGLLKLSTIAHGISTDDTPRVAGYLAAYEIAKKYLVLLD